ncbi:MAG: hypothetical protein M0T84_05225 [Betaproteobacteria bacterium]|nr:hypothetical protein [Betaproteobacteria bacterium]
MKSEKCAGFIQLVFFDDSMGEIVTLGGAGFVTQAEDDAAWENVPTFEGVSNFMADRMDSSRDIYDDKPVSAETCERLMGKPIATLIREGRAMLTASLSELGCRPMKYPACAAVL